MMKLVSIISLAALAGSALVVGCSSSSSSSSSSGGSADAGKDSAVIKTDGGPKTDSGGGGDTDAGAAPSSVGIECTTSAQCTAGDQPACGNAAFTEPLSPTPTGCVDTCTIVDKTKIELCGNDQGVCLGVSATTNDGVCFGACEFNETGVTAKCAGKGACNPYGFGTDTTTNKAFGVGYCFGGCLTDADCGGTNKCDTTSRLCHKAAITYAKTVGAACDSSKKPAECNCGASSKAPTMGTCMVACTAGDANACASGFACVTGSPATDSKGAALFGTEPKGVEGACNKICTLDTECNPGFSCQAGPGGVKTCDIKP